PATLHSNSTFTYRYRDLRRVLPSPTRALPIFPTILSVSVMGLLWKWMFENRTGLVNVVLDMIPFTDPVAFLTTIGLAWIPIIVRSEEHTSELQSRENLVCRPLLEKKKETTETS